MIKKNLNQNKLNVLSQLVMNKIDDLFAELGVDASISGNKYIGCCPVHGGDKYGALNLYYEGYSVPGYWVCRTRSCEEHFGRNIIGFTRGVLSREHNWQPEDGKTRNQYSFDKTIKFLCNFVGTTLDKIKIDEKKAERLIFVVECNKEKVYVEQDGGITRDVVRKNLIVPAEYYLKRGYSSEILDKYDVGMSKKPKPETKDRVIVPVYNKKNRFMGYTARSIFEKCECGFFHNNTLPCPITLQEKNACSKWRNNFECSNYLYNYNHAESHMKKTGVAILVEGPGDVWKLEQSGIHNAVAMFGINLHDAQETLLSQAGVMSLIVLSDNDDAGDKSIRSIKKKYGRLYRMFFPTIKNHDVGEMNTDMITSDIKPVIEKAIGIYER